MAFKANQSAELRWENLTMVTRATKKAPSRTILDEANGIARPGEFLAIMGPSGAGKTTLLNCLSGKYQKNLILTSGSVFINYHPIEEVDYRSMIGFVPQDDILLESMTTRESLDFSAALTLNLTEEERQRKVNELIEELGLTGCADSMIGGHIIRGLSGGEKKRASIGVELIFSPSVLFLDEPTTGLDSFTALNIMNLLSNLAKQKNCTVIATIHQPNSQIFNSFDKLLLLVGGSSVFMDRAKHATDFFKEIGDPVPENYNPADHYMNVLSKEKFQNVEYRKKLTEKIHRQSTAMMGNKEKPIGHYQASFFFAFSLLFKRAMRESLRNPIILKGKIAKMIISGALCCMTFANLGTSSEHMIDRFGAIFMLINNTVMEAITGTLATFQTQKPVFFREHFNRKYGVSAFFLSYIIAIIPIEIVYSIGLYAISYFVMGLNPAVDRFFTMLGLSILGTMTGSGYGILISVVAPSMEVATAIAPLVFLPFMLSGGFLVSYKQVPKWFFFQYISPMRYGFESGIRTDIEHNPDIKHSVSHSTIKDLHCPESYIEGIFAMLGLLLTLRLISGVLLKIMSRKV